MTDTNGDAVSYSYQGIWTRLPLTGITLRLLRRLTPPTRTNLYRPWMRRSRHAAKGVFSGLASGSAKLRLHEALALLGTSSHAGWGLMADYCCPPRHPDCACNLRRA